MILPSRITPPTASSFLLFSPSAGWSKIPFYVVGEGTATALQNAFGLFPFKIDIDIRGQASGNAVTLAPFMLSDIKEKPVKLLYLTGDKNRDTLTNLLTEGGITLEALQVYETVGSPQFEERLVRVLDDPPKGKPNFMTRRVIY